MKYEVVSSVNVFGIIFTDTYIHEFDDDSNVFGRVLEYHKRMHEVFPHKEFKLVKATLIEGKKS